MALNYPTDADYGVAGRITPADPNYPFGSSKDETSPGAGDGMPYKKRRADDILGLQQWLFKLVGITPSGNADTALLSDQGDGLSFLAAAADKASWPTIANNGTKDIDFGPGSILSITGRKPITLGSQLIKQLDVAWAVGDAAGGLFSGSIAASTTYHCFLIVKDSDLTVDAGFDTDLGAANIPTGYTAYRRIGSIYTDGTPDIVPFTQYGDFFELVTPAADLSSATGSIGGTTLPVSIPDGGLSSLFVDANMRLLDTGNAGAWFRSTNVVNQTPSEVNSELRVSSGSNRSVMNKRIPVTAGALIQYRNGTFTAGTIDLLTNGWIDPRSE